MAASQSPDPDEPGGPVRPGEEDQISDLLRTRTVCRVVNRGSAQSCVVQQATAALEGIEPLPTWFYRRSSHAEPRALHDFDRPSGSAHLGVCRALPTEEVEQQLAWRSGDAHGRFPPPCSNGLGDPAH
jgi:hypothetical protein